MTVRESWMSRDGGKKKKLTSPNDSLVSILRKIINQFSILFESEL